ncbi:unnamed protein product, partial [Rangifer tarandus platyrhynchus]
MRLREAQGHRTSSVRFDPCRVGVCSVSLVPPQWVLSPPRFSRPTSASLPPGGALCGSTPPASSPGRVPASPRTHPSLWLSLCVEFGGF